MNGFLHQRWQVIRQLVVEITRLVPEAYGRERRNLAERGR